MRLYIYSNAIVLCSTFVAVGLLLGKNWQRLSVYRNVLNKINYIAISLTCMYICNCMFTHAYVCIYIYNTHTYVHTHTHSRAYTYAHACTHKK